ncbi:MAG: hypothetical protein EOP10_01375 [Proteobacteria bacterium]|nr:MAG: hypothetical protein EOP10_01375 [Pseudomonadota bacterium]
MQKSFDCPALSNTLKRPIQESTTEALMHPVNILFSLILLGLPWAWLAGVYVADASRLLAGALILTAIATPKIRTFSISDQRLRQVSLGFVLIFPLALLTFLLARMHLGRIGIDFTMFAQAIDSLARTGTPWTSLLGTQWQNFFGHHLDLILYLPAALTVLGVNAPLAAVLCHVLAISLLIYFLWKILSADKHLLLLLPLFFTLPTIRHALLWSIHDDIYALPFLAASWWLWRQKRYTSMSITLLLTLVCKETMGLWVGSFALMAFIHDRKKSHLAFVALGFSVFLGYVVLQPILLGKSFDHIGKVASLAQLTNPTLLLEKLWFFVNLLFPFLLLLTNTKLTKQDAILFLPALPFLGMIAVSNFTEMWKPLNYYGLIPSLTCFLACMHIKSRSNTKPNHFTLALIVSLSFGTGTLRIGPQIVEALKTSSTAAPSLKAFANNTSIAISPSAHLKLLQSQISPLPGAQFPGRAIQYQANHQLPDLVLFKTGEEEDFPAEFLKGKKCLLDNDWTYLCPDHSKSPKP